MMNARRWSFFVPGFIACLSVAALLSVGVSRAGDRLSRRRAMMTRTAGCSRHARTSRRALGAPVRRFVASRPGTASSGDSLGRRAFRSVFRLDARGGGIHGAIGQHMARGAGSEFARRRTAQRWQNGVGYAINAGRAARYLGHALVRP